MAARSWVLALALLIGAMCALAEQGLENGTRTPKRYTIDLDLPAEKRWSEVMIGHKTSFVTTVRTLFEKFVPKELFALAEQISDELEKYLPSPYAGEIKGIANALGISVGEVVMFNIVYDVSAFCTSIVSQDSRGQIWHSRNLDYAFGDGLRNLTIVVDFKSGGKVVYSSVTCAGYVGIFTGQGPNRFTISIDQRGGGDSVTHLIENILVALLVDHVVPTTFLVRDAFMKSANFSAAVELLSKTATPAPVYFIIAGVQPGEGAVITKDRLEARDVWTLDPAHGRWFEVETNYDHWLPPPTRDDRRDPANKCMTSLGQAKISVTSLFGVMSTHPILNNSTVYTTVMSAAQPKLMQSWIQNVQN